PRQAGRGPEADHRRGLRADPAHRLQRDQGGQGGEPAGRIQNRGEEVSPVVRVGTAETADGALLHWRADGEGPRALIACNGIGVSTFFWRRLARHFAPTHTFVTW